MVQGAPAPWYFDVVRGPIRMVDGFWQVPDAPGLGVEVETDGGRKLANVVRTPFYDPMRLRTHPADERTA